MSQLLLGRAFTESNVINVLIALLEIAAVMGFYASPALIYRYSMRMAGLADKEAKHFNSIVTAAFLIVVGLAVIFVPISALTLLGILIWCPMNFLILTSGQILPDGSTKPSNFLVALFDKYQEIVIYLIVGVFTTVVSWGVFFVLSFILDSNNGFLLTINTILNWSAGVLVAYPMNRVWVFHSKNPEKFKEFLGFTASRVTTLIIEEVVMVVCVNVIGINQFVSKYVIASILVIILNYVFSKLMVFKKKTSKSE